MVAYVTGRLLTLGGVDNPLSACVHVCVCVCVCVYTCAGSTFTKQYKMYFVHYLLQAKLYKPIV